MKISLTELAPQFIDENFIVRNGTRIVGVLNPSTLIERTERRVTSVLGPLGVVEIPDVGGPENIIVALSAVGAILLGTGDDAVEVSQLLFNDRWSRTVSHLLALSRDCAEVLRTQHAIQRTSVHVVGCGGIGSLVTALLAGAGFESLALVDGDKVESSNLNRQFFWTRADVGSEKVEVLSKAIGARFPDVRIKNLSKKVDLGQLESVVGLSDVVVLSADEPLGLVQEIAALAARHPGRIFISCGYSFGTASVTLHSSDNNRRLSPTTSEWLPLRNAVMPSFGPINVEIAGRVVALLIEILAGRRPTKEGFQITWRPNELSSTAVESFETNIC